MTQQRFDHHTAIKELAEMEQPCTYHHVGVIEGVEVETLCINGKLSVNGQGHMPHEACGGTGHIVPFATLRVEKQGVWSHRDCRSLGRCDMFLDDGSMVRNTTDCEGRGWVPEPDVEKAVERIIEHCWLPPAGRSIWPDFVRRMIDTQIENDCDFKEAVLRAALKWIKKGA